MILKNLKKNLQILQKLWKDFWKVSISMTFYENSENVWEKISEKLKN